MVSEFTVAVQSALRGGRPGACLDTCVWLDFLRGRYEAKEARTAFDKLSRRIGNDVTVVIPNQILIEFDRNKDEIVNGYGALLKRIAEDFKKYHEDFLEAVDPELVLLNGDFDSYVKNRCELPVAKLLKSVDAFRPLPSHYEAAAMRSCMRKAPSKRRQSSSADSLIVESFIGLLTELRSHGFDHHAYFVTVNTTDFSDEHEKNKVHSDLSIEFLQNKIEYVCDIRRFVNMNGY